MIFFYFVIMEFNTKWTPFLSLFVWGFFPLKNFSLIWGRHLCRWGAANFDLCSALMALQQRGFFSVPHLLWHRHPFIMVIYEDPWHSHPSVWQWKVEMSLLVLTTYVCRGWDSNTHPSSCGANAITHCATAAAVCFLELSIY